MAVTRESALGSGVGEVRHRDVGDELADVVQRGQLVGVEAFVGGEVRYLDAQEVVEVPGYVVAFADLGDLADSVLEAADVVALMTDEPDRDERGQAMPFGFRIDDRPVSPDDPGVLKAPQSPGAGRRGQSGASCQFRHCGSAIVAQVTENQAVGVVKCLHKANPCTTCGGYAIPVHSPGAPA